MFYVSSVVTFVSAFLSTYTPVFLLTLHIVRSIKESGYLSVPLTQFL